jgi:Phage tail lysozyme
VRSASSHHKKSSRSKSTGRHRAGSRGRKTIKIVGVAVPAVALIAAFVVYEAQPQQPNPVASAVAGYHLRTLPSGGAVADGSGMALTTKSPSGTKSSKNRQSGKTAASTKSAANAGSAHRRRSATHVPARPPSSASNQGGQSAAPSPSPSASSSTSLKAAVRKDIADGNYLLAVAQYLVENGYSRTAAAGVASCVDGESGGNPESVGSGGGGLIGWTPIGAAAPNSNIITGNASQDMYTQLSDLLYYNSSEIGQSLVNQLDSISDPVSAADFFSENFEKPAITNSDVVPSVAEQIYSELG